MHKHYTVQNLKKALRTAKTTHASIEFATIANISSSPCTLSLPDGQVVYKLPSQVAICQDAVIRDVIGGDELERHLSLSYLHPELSKDPPTSLLAHLGVRYLRGADVSTVTTAMAKELMRVEGIHSGV